MADIYNLERFKQAQDLGVYDKALEEVQNGRKTGHWIWFIFPQMRGFGSSYNSHFYGITLKVRSCMTLFDFISPNDLFGQVLDAKYDGARDLDSLALLQNPHHKPAEPRKRLFNPNA